MAAITLFTAVKPFTDSDTTRAQRNALRSWVALGESVQVLLIGDESGAAEAARDVGVEFVPEVERTHSGTPKIRSLFDQARRHSTSPLLGYLNADIILLADFLPALAAAAPLPDFLLVSRRWDLRVEQALDFAGDWEETLRTLLRTSGKRHGLGGSDLFVFRRDAFTEVPPLAVGRAGWDNWMIFEARRRRWPVVEIGNRVTVVHQDHDYRHLPGGRPHYRHPESDANLRLAGGRAAAFNLLDADWTFDDRGIRPKRMAERRLARSLEAALLVRLAPALRTAVHAAFHPGWAIGALRGWLAWKLGRAPGSAAAERPS